MTISDFIVRLRLGRTVRDFNLAQNRKSDGYYEYEACFDDNFSLWKKMSKVKYTTYYDSLTEEITFSPVFSEAIQDLRGREIVISGYVLGQLKDTVISAAPYPHSCWGAEKTHAGRIKIDTKTFNSDLPLRKGDYVCLRGNLSSEDSGDMIYILKNAAVLENKTLQLEIEKSLIVKRMELPSSHENKKMWRTLSKVRYISSTDQLSGEIIYQPKFSASIKKYDGELIQLTGYYMETIFNPDLRGIKSSSLPVRSCCSRMRPEQMIAFENKAKLEMKNNTKITIKGRLNVNKDDPLTLLYELELLEIFIHKED